jgi:hypothetical protein
MKKNYLSVLLVFFFSVHQLFSQTIDSYIHNDSIRYNIIFISRSAIGKMKDQPSKYRIVIDMPASIRNTFLEKPNEYWFEKLKSESSDWAATLILYYLYDFDAFIIRGVNNEKAMWSRVRQKETDDWIRFLNSKN